ncbi:unnamed protein product [Schistosoma margrebowiei]|uniref:Uncharacterized protein n=1 Tax=Schistosoma margrebowiei TaxID=48269 RepID=A0A183MPN7_9TREM|nr:unnamed protein product [Schistosoma margrebowiei]
MSTLVVFNCFNCMSTLLLCAHIYLYYLNNNTNLLLTIFQDVIIHSTYGHSPDDGTEYVSNNNTKK